jgi:PAS domain S-box-containing protein
MSATEAARLDVNPAAGPASRAQLAALEAAANGIVITDRRGRIEWVNPAFTRMTGYTAEDAIGQTPRLLKSGQHEPAFYEQLWATIRRGGVWQGEMVNRRKDGTIYNEEQSITPVRDAEGGIGHFIAIKQDVTDRKRAEAALVAREAHFRALIERSADIITVLAPDGEIRYESPSLEIVLGYSPAATVGRNAFELVHPDDLPAVIDAMATVSEGPGSVATLRFRFRHKDGSWRHLEGVGRNCLDEPSVAGVIVNSRDVTEQVGLEERLLSANRALRVRAAWSEALVRTADEAELLQRVCDIIVDVGGFRAAQVRLRGTDAPPVTRSIGPAGSEAPLPSPDGQAGSGAADAGPLAGAPGPRRTTPSSIALPLSAGHRLLGVLSIQGPPPSEDEMALLAQLANDLAYGIDALRTRAEGERAAADLRASSQALAAVFDASPVALTTIDREGRVTMWSTAAERMFGWPAAEVLGRPLPFVPADRRGEYADHMEALLDNRSFTDHQTLRLRKDGALVEVSISGAPLTAGDGRVTGAMAVLIDIAERRRLEAQLRQAQKMEAIGLLAGGVAHDFNNLLTVITGHSQLALHRLDPDHPLRRSVETINSTATRAAGLTRQLLAFSRRQARQPRVLEVAKLVGDVVPMLRRLLGEDIQVEADFSPETGRIHADPAQLEQVLFNLAVNARDAMPHGGRLRISTANVELTAGAGEACPPGPHVRLRVEDTGTGMAPEVRARIFEPFFTTKEADRGTGLGLSIVRGVVSEHGGRIEVDSTLGQGTSFTIDLPRTQQPLPALVNGTPATPRGGSETILVVEDDDGVRQMTAEALTSFGYRVLTAAGPTPALQLFAQHKEAVDLLLTDMVMPEMTGRELSARIAATAPGLRILYMTGYTDEVLGRRGLPTGEGAAILRKPMTMATLAARVRETLAAPAAGAALVASAGDGDRR